MCQPPDCLSKMRRTDMEYRYHLLKYKGPSSRLTCPSCGRKHCFTPYVDKDDQIVGEEYGRCDHESSCGYVKYPPSEKEWRESYSEYRQRTQKPKSRVVARPQPKPEPAKGICTIPMETVVKTVRTKPLSDFLYFLLTLFDVDTIVRLVKEYLIGVTKAGDAIFYQIDGKNRCRSGKVMKYDRETGHRIKEKTDTARGHLPVLPQKFISVKDPYFFKSFTLSKPTILEKKIKNRSRIASIAVLM